MKNKVFFVLTIIWMVIIFSFSARPADVSTEDSYAVGLKIGSVFVSGFDELSEEEQLAFAAKIDHPVRKTAHGLEYAVLGILVINAGYSFFLKRLGFILNILPLKKDICTLNLFMIYLFRPLRKDFFFFCFFFLLISYFYFFQ